MITDFLTNIGGAYNEELKKFPEERTKYVIIGLFVCNTAFLSFLTMNFALHSLYPHKNDILTYTIITVVGLVWGFMIFTIDWGLIKTMIKEPFTTWGRFFQIVIIPTMLRMLVAGLISFTISKPFEVRVAGERLTPEIQKNKTDFLRREREKHEKEMTTKRDSLNSLIENTKKLVTERENKPTGTFDVVQGVLNSTNTDISNLESNISDLERQLATPGVGYIRECYKKDSIGRCLYRNRRTPRGIQIVQELSQKRASVGKKIEEKDSLNNQTISIVKEHEGNIDSLLIIQNSELGNVQTEMFKLDSLNTVFYKELTDKANTAYDDKSLLNQIEALETLSDSDQSSSIFWTKWLIFFVILTVDLMPIFIKLLSDYGNYDKRMAELKTEKEVENRQRRFTLREEFKTNKGLIQKMAKSQRNIISESLKNWEAEEKRKVNSKNNDDPMFS